MTTEPTETESTETESTVHYVEVPRDITAEDIVKHLHDPLLRNGIKDIVQEALYAIGYTNFYR